MDFASMKRRDLQALCKRHGLPGGGTNADLVARLAAALPGCGGAEEQAVEVLAGKGCLKRLAGGSSGGGSDASKKVTFVLEDEVEVEVEDRIRGRRRTRGEQKASVTLPGAEVGGVECRRTCAQVGVGSVDGSDAGEVATDAPVRRSRRNALNLDTGDGVEMVAAVVSQSNSAKTVEEDKEAGEVVDRKRKRKTRDNDGGVDVSGQIEVSRRSTRSSGVPSGPATMSSPVVEKKRGRRKTGDVKKQTCAEEQTSEVQHLGRTLRSGSVVVSSVPPIISESKRSRRKLQEEETAVEKVAKVEISGRTTRSSSVAAAMTSPIVVEKKRVMRKAGDVTKQTCAEEQTSEVEHLGRTLRSGLVVAGPVSPIVSESKRSRRKLHKEEPDVKKVAKVEISGRTTRSGSVAAAVTSPIVVEKSRRKTEDLPAVVEKERKGLTKEVIPEAHVRQSTQKSAVPAMLEKQRKGIPAEMNPDAHVIVRRSTRKSIVPSMLDNEINDHDKMRSAEVGGVEQPVRRLTRKSVVCPVIQKVAKVEKSGRTTRSGSVAAAVMSPIVVEKRRRKAEHLPAVVEKERKGLTKEVIPEAHVRQSTQKSAAPAMLEKQRKGIPAEMNPDAHVIVRRSTRKSIVPSMLDNEINDHDRMRSAEVGGVKKQLGVEQPVTRLTRKSVAWPVFEKGNKGLHKEMKPEVPAKKSASNSVAPNVVDKMNNGHIVRTEESGVRTRNSQTRLQFAAQNDESLQGTTNKSSKLVISNLQSNPTASQGRPAKRMKTKVLHMPAEEPNADDMVIREATQDGDKVTHEHSEVSIGRIQEIKQVNATVEEFPSAPLIGTLLEDTHGVHSVNEEIHESESGLAKSSHEEQVASGSLVFLEAANCFEKTNSDEVVCKDEENKKSVNYINSSCEQTEANGHGEHAYCISDTSMSSSLIAPANDDDELHHSLDLSRLESTDTLDEPIACSNTEVPEQGFKEQREVLHMLVGEPNADGAVIREAMQDGDEVTREYTEVSNTCIQEIRQVNTIEEELLEDPHRVPSMNKEINEPESGLTKSTHEEQVASGPLIVLEAANCMETNNSEEVACKDEENKKPVNYINSSYEPTDANRHDFLGEPIGCTEVPQEDFKEKCEVLNMPVEEPNVDGTPIREAMPDSDEVTQEYTEVPSSCIQDISQVNATGEEVPSALLLGTLLEDTRRAQSMNVEIHELESGLTKSHHEEEHVASGHPLVVLEAANCMEKTNSEEVDRKDEENKKPMNYIDSSCKPTNAKGPGCSNTEVPQSGIKKQCEVLHMLVEESNADGTVIREAMQDGDEVTREYTEVSSSCIQEIRQVNTLEEELLEDPHRVQDMNEEIHESGSGLTESTHEEDQVASDQVVVLEAANCMDRNNNSEEVACKDEENKKPVNYINSSCEPTDAVRPGCTEVPQEDFKGKCEALDMPVEEPNADGTPIMEAMPDSDGVTQEYTEVPSNCIQQIGQVNATGEEVPSALLLGTLFEDTRRAQYMNVEIHESESELIKSLHEEHVASGHLVVLEAANCTEKTNSEEVDYKDEENKKPVDYIDSSCKPTNADGPAELLGDTLLSSSLVAPANDELYRSSDTSRLESTDFLEGLIGCSNTEVPQQGIKEQCEVHKKEQVVYGAHSDLIEVAAVKDLESGMPPLPAVEKSNMRDEQPNSKLEGMKVEESGLSCDKSNINILDFGSALNCVVEKAPSGSSLSEDSAMDHLENSDLVAGGTIEQLPFDLAIPNYNVGASSKEVVDGLKNDAERCSPKSQAPTHWATFSTEKSYSMASGMSEDAMTEGSESGKALMPAVEASALLDVQLNPKLEGDEFKEHNLNCGEESVDIFGAGSVKNGVSHLGKDSLTNSCQEQGEAPNDQSARKSPEGYAVFQVECVMRSGICQTIGQRFTDETSTKDHTEEHNGQNEDQVTTGILANGMSEPALFGGLDRVMLPTAETSALPDEKFNTELEVDGEYSLFCDKDSSNISDTGPVGDNNLSTLKDDPCHGMPAPTSPEESSIHLDDGFSASEGICQTSGRRRVDEISTKLLTFKISSTVKGSYIAMDASGCAKQGDNLSQSAVAFLGNSENTLAAETDPPNLNTDHSVSKDSSTQMLQGISGGLSDVVLTADNPDNRLTVEQVQQDDVQVQEGILDKTLLGSVTPECKHDCGLLHEEVLQSTGNDRCSSSVGQPPFGLQSLFLHENVEEPMEYDASDVGLAADHPAIKLAVELVQQDGVQVQEGTLEKTALGSATPECKHESRLTEEVELQSMKNERCSSSAEQSPFGLQSLFSQESIEEPVRYDALSLARVKGESGGSKDEYKVEKSPLPEPSSDHGTQVDLRVVSKAGDCVYTSQQDDEKEGLTKASHEQEQVAPGQLDFLDAANNMEKSLVAPTMGHDKILPSHSLHQLESTDFMDEPIGCSNAEVLKNPRPSEESDENKED